jgi:hypothetical protein
MESSFMFGKNLINKMLAALAVLAGAAVCATPAGAATITVPTDQPTIAAAYAAAAASGDVIALMSGTYSEDNLLLGAAKTVTIQEAAGQTAIFNRRANVTDGVVTIIGVDFVKDATSQPICFGASGNGRFILENMSITDNAGSPGGSALESTATATGGFTANNLTVTIDDNPANSTIYCGGASTNNFNNSSFTFSGGGNAIYNIGTAVSTYTGCTFNGSVPSNYAQSDGGTQNFVNATSNVTSSIFAYTNGGNTGINGWTQLSGSLTYITQVNDGRTCNLSGTIAHNGGTLSTPFIFVAGTNATLAMNNVTFSQTAGAFSYIQCSPGRITNTGTFTAQGADFPGYWAYLTGGNAALNNLTLAGTNQPYINLVGDATANITGSLSQTGSPNPYLVNAAAAPQKVTYSNVTFSGANLPYTQVSGGAIAEATGTITANPGASFAGGITLYTSNAGVFNLNNLTLSGPFSQFIQSDAASAVTNITGTNSFSNNGWPVYANGGTVNISGSSAISTLTNLVEFHGGNAASIVLNNATITGGIGGAIFSLGGTGVQASTVTGSTISAACSQTFLVNNRNATLSINESAVSKASGGGELFQIAAAGGTVNINDSTLTKSPDGNRLAITTGTSDTVTINASRSIFDARDANTNDSRVLQLASGTGNSNHVNLVNCALIWGSAGNPGAIGTNGGGNLDLRYCTFNSTVTAANNPAIRMSGGNGGTVNIVAHNNIFNLPGSTGANTGALAELAGSTTNLLASKNLRNVAGAGANDVLAGTIVEADPLLADLYHLSNTSFDAIGKADQVVTVADDIDGDPRPGASHFPANDYDLGADQNAVVPVEISNFSID